MASLRRGEALAIATSAWALPPRAHRLQEAIRKAPGIRPEEHEGLNSQFRVGQWPTPFVSPSRGAEPADLRESSAQRFKGRLG
jgi:hypothetical protein